MDCGLCESPIDSFELETYDCNYDELAQAACNGCLACSFVLECIRTGAADVHFSEIVKIYVLSDYYCELNLPNRSISLDIFPDTVENGSAPYIRHSRNHIPGATDSDATIATIQSWITDCTTTHGACQHFHPPVQYPKRILDLSGQSVILRENFQPTRYACLSHCWGVNSEVTKTTTNNVNEFMTNIPWDQLTATFRDAITICRRLEIFYLWIDSLCIIQDSEDDWKDQASKMAGNYESSFITIAATKSRNSSEGCFTKCDQKYLSKVVPGYPNHYVRQLPPSFPSHWNCGELDRSSNWPLLNRAWIYQEMRLSQRVLHFCAQEVVWQCQTVQRSESGSNDKDLSDDGEYGELQHQGVPYSILEKSPRYLWYRTVQDYSRLEMTFESDKMPALAGLATRMGTMRHGDRYLAGLWEKTLLFDLLWFVESNPVPGKPRNPRFPSWNWASVNCQVMWSENIDSTLTSVRVKEVRFVATGPSHLGEFSEATVAIQAPLVDASLFLSPDRHTPYDASHNDVTMEQLYLVDYKVDCLPPVSSPTHYKPDPSGFVVPIGVSMAYHVFFALYVRLRPGSTYYERLGYVELSHLSMRRRLETIDDCDSESQAGIHRDTVCMKELLESLPTSTIVLV